MNCPNCGKEMEQGRLTAGGYSIRWVPDGESTFLSVFSDRTITISRLSFSSKGIPAYVCQTCRKLIADYENTN